MTTLNTLEDTLTPLALTLAAIQDQIATWQDEERQIKITIRELVVDSGPDTYKAGGLSVVVSNNRRYDAAKAMTLISDALRPQVVEDVPTVNKEKLKALAPHIFDAAQTYGDMRVSLR